MILIKTGSSDNTKHTHTLLHMRAIISKNDTHPCLVAIIDFHQDPKESESSGGVQPDVGAAIRIELLRHQPCRPLGVILTGQYICLFVFLLMASSLFYKLIPLCSPRVLFQLPGRTEQAGPGPAQWPVQQHRLLLPPVQSRPLAGERFLTHSYAFVRAGQLPQKCIETDIHEYSLSDYIHLCVLKL